MLNKLTNEHDLCNSHLTIYTLSSHLRQLQQMESSSSKHAHESVFNSLTLNSLYSGMACP